jgi:hypothetical protein
MANWGLPLAAIADMKKDPEKISGNMTTGKKEEKKEKEERRKRRKRRSLLSTSIDHDPLCSQQCASTRGSSCDLHGG